jgi:phosphoadenosine phosphosulfate reductase
MPAVGDAVLSPEQIALAARDLEGSGPEAALRWAVDHFGPEEIALACSFGSEDMALVDMIAKIRPESRVFYLDTNLLFDETYALIEKAKAKYPVRFEQHLPLITLGHQADQHGDELWIHRPDACCAIRKVEPLQRVLSSLKAWITGIRREQSPTRANAQVVEWDAKFGLVKINPIVAWSEKDLWRYMMDQKVPYNPMHDQGYPSIGCTHCTRAVKPGEDPRAGRWAGNAKTECGLHQ